MKWFVSTQRMGWGQMGAPAVPALIQTWQEALEDTASPRIRRPRTFRHATYALSAIGELAVPALIDTLQDKNESIRVSAAYALGDIGSAAQEAVPSLTQALRDESAWMRRHATEALGLIGQPVQHTVPALIDLTAR